VRRLEALRNERSARRERLGTAKLAVDAGQPQRQAGGRAARRVEVLRRPADRARPRPRHPARRPAGPDRPNGAGKSTLLKLILGELAPDAGTVKLGTNLSVAYFDQLRTQLDEEKTVAETVCPGGRLDRGRRQPQARDRLPRRVPVPAAPRRGAGENALRRRAQPAAAGAAVRPAGQPAGADEPTNDLDIESLELLESLLADYAGHAAAGQPRPRISGRDRHPVVGCRGDGLWREYAGGYTDWLAQRPASAAPAPAAPAAAAPAPPAPRRSERVKLSYNEQRELAALPAELEALENEQAALLARMSAADYHTAGAQQMKADVGRAAEVERLLEEKLARWMALEDKAKAAAERP